MNTLIGLALITTGIYTLFRVFNNKPLKQLIFKHQIFWFEVLFGKKHAYNALLIFTSIIEITFGLAFILGKLTL